jgi:hypothetical protein
MSLGLRSGFDEPSDVTGKARIGDAVLDLCRRFETQHGSIVCRELLGCELDEARARGLFESLCPAFVETAARILDDLT